MPVLESLVGAPVSIDTAKARGRAPGARARRRARQRRHCAARRPGARRGGGRRGRLPLPDAHAGEPRTMQVEPALRRRRLRREGVPRGAARVRGRGGVPEELVCLDPGIGFGKTVEHNFELVRRLDGAGRDRPADRRRLLAQEFARADTRRPAARSDRRRPRSGRRSPPTSAAPRSSVRTTCATTSRRCGPRER